MPAISTLTVADSAAANITLHPISASLASSRFSQRDAAILAGNREVEFKLSLATTQRKTDRVTILFSKPIVRTVDGLDQVTDIARATLEFVVPSALTSTERDDLYSEVVSLVGTAGVEAYVADRDPYY